MLPCMNRPAQRPSVAAGALVSARAQDAGFGPFRTAGSIVMLHGTLNRTADRRPLSSVCVTSAQWSVSAAMRSNGAQVALDPAIAKSVAARKPAPLLLRAGLSSGSQPSPDGPSITGATSHGAETGCWGHVSSLCSPSTKSTPSTGKRSRDRENILGGRRPGCVLAANRHAAVRVFSLP